MNANSLFDYRYVIFGDDEEYDDCCYDVVMYVIKISKHIHQFGYCLFNIDESNAFGCLDSGVI